LVAAKGRGKGDLSVSLALDRVRGPTHQARLELASAVAAAAAAAAGGDGVSKEDDDDAALEALVRRFSSAPAARSQPAQAGVAAAEAEAEAEAEAAARALAAFVRSRHPPLDVAAWLRAADAPPALVAAADAALDAAAHLLAPEPAAEPLREAAAGDAAAAAAAAAAEAAPVVSLARPAPPPLPPPPPSAFIRRYAQTALGASSAAGAKPAVARAANSAGSESADAMLARIRLRLAAASGSANAADAAAAPPLPLLLKTAAAASLAFSSTAGPAAVAERLPLGEATNQPPLNVADRLARLKTRSGSSRFALDEGDGGAGTAPELPLPPPLALPAGKALALEPSVADRLAALRARLPAAKNA
jgi:hypothetical protein